MKTKNIVGKILFLGVVGLSIFILFFVVSCVWIGYEVKSQCQTAEREYLPAGRQVVDTDCVDSLITLLNDENRGLRARNDAIWALGQLGDKRALPVLQKYYTSNIPDREPLAKVISQYELKKAIVLAEGGLNITAIFWRYGIN